MSRPASLRLLAAAMLAACVGFRREAVGKVGVAIIGLLVVPSAATGSRER